MKERPQGLVSQADALLLLQKTDSVSMPAGQIRFAQEDTAIKTDAGAKGLFSGGRSEWSFFIF